MNETETQRIRYALAKQIGSAYAICTDYGDIALDDELARAVRDALEPLMERRLADLKPVER